MVLGALGMNLWHLIDVKKSLKKPKIHSFLRLCNSKKKSKVTPRLTGGLKYMFEELVTRFLGNLRVRQIAGSTLNKAFFSKKPKICDFQSAVTLTPFNRFQGILVHLKAVLKYKRL